MIQGRGAPEQCAVWKLFEGTESKFTLISRPHKCKTHNSDSFCSWNHALKTLETHPFLLSERQNGFDFGGQNPRVLIVFLSVSPQARFSSTVYVRAEVVPTAPSSLLSDNRAC